LGIQDVCETDLVEISPLVSYDGKEGIPEILAHLRKMEAIGYPLLIDE
jgi:hypothetical protein